MRGTSNSLQELEQLIDRMWERFETEGVVGDLPVDVVESDGAFVVTADMPGCERGDIRVRLLDPRTLRISMDREEVVDERDERYVLHERRRHSASRRLHLPAPVYESGVNARFRNGVLTVTLPRSETEAEEGTSIAISE